MNRWTGVVFVTPLLGVTAYALAVFGFEWRGSWPGTVDAVIGTTVLTGPLTAAFGAHLALAQSRLAEITDVATRSRWVPARCASRSWAWATAVYLLAAAVAAAMTASVRHGGSLQPWALLVGVVLLGACSFAGVLAVACWPHRMTVVLIGPAVFLLGTFGPVSLRALLRHGPATGSLAGLQYVSATWLLEAVATVALVFLLAGLTDLVRTRQPGRGWSPALVVGLAAAVAFGAGHGLRGAQKERFEASAERPTACRGAEPRICLAPSHGRLLGPVRSAMRPAIEELQKIGVTLPDRYEEALPGHRPPITAGVVDPRNLGGIPNVLNVAACPGWFASSDPPPEAAFDARQVIADWISVRVGEPVPPGNDDERAWLESGDEGAAVGWIRRTVEQLRTCRLEQIRLPWAG